MTTPAIDRIEVSAFTVPTDEPEGDGTLEWDSTTIVVVQAHAGQTTGLGYTYADLSTAKLIESKLAGIVEGMRVPSPQASWAAMVRATRNLGRPGITSMAIAAVDLALWDLHARLLDAPLCTVLGMAHDHVPVYGSGGFTTYTIDRLQQQLSGWSGQGIPRVKMKIGAHPDQRQRARARRAEAIGPTIELFVDANGAYSASRPSAR